jgi:hypothetical protein
MKKWKEREQKDSLNSKQWKDIFEIRGIFEFKRGTFTGKE